MRMRLYNVFIDCCVSYFIFSGLLFFRMSDTLVLDVRAGLGNRLQALISGICMAQDTGKKLHVIWAPEEACNAKFQDLFQKDCLPLWIKINLGPCMETPVKILNQADADRYIQSKDRRPILSYSRFYVRNEDIWMEWSRRLMPAFALPTLPRIDGGRRIGVHIRRGDHTESRTKSPLHLFIDAMVKEPESTVFVVASDGFDERIALEKLFGYRVFFPSSVISRTNVKGMKDAVADMFSLAMCDMIYGSSGTTFSNMAAMLGDIPLHVLRTV